MDESALRGRGSFAALPCSAFLVLSALLLECISAAPVLAQTPSPITVTSSASNAWLAADATLELAAEGWQPSLGRLAVMIGEVDWTALFESTPRGLRFQPTAVKLPP